MLDVIDGLGPLSQPELLQTRESDASIGSAQGSEAEVMTAAVVAPIPCQLAFFDN